MTATADEAASGPVAVASPEPMASAAVPSESAGGLASPAALASASAGSGPTIEPTPAVARIGYIPHDASQWYVQDISSGIRAAATAAGLELVECAPGMEPESVRECAQQLADAGVAGFVSMQPFAQLSEEVCTTVGDVPAVGILYDQGPCQVSLLEVDQTESGRVAGAALGALAADRWDCAVKSYVALGSGPGDAIGAARMEGFRAGYREHCPLPKNQQALSGTQYLITAQTQMDQVLKRTAGKPIVVAGVTDLAALGALRSAQEQGRQNQVWVAGQLVDPAARRAIACDRHYVASAAQFPERFGEVVVAALLDAIEGREVAPTLEAGVSRVTAKNVRELFPDTPACDA